MTRLRDTVYPQIARHAALPAAVLVLTLLFTWAGTLADAWQRHAVHPPTGRPLLVPLSTAPGGSRHTGRVNSPFACIG